MYMAGFVIECLLKALLLERHPNLQGRVDPAKLSKSDAEAYGLLYGHELDAMLNFLPEVEAKLKRLEAVEHRAMWRPFLAVCEQWTVYARYSPSQAKNRTPRSLLRQTKR
jgi:hypothetical protein